MCFFGFLFWVVFWGLFGCGVRGFGCTSAWFWLVVGVVYVVFGVFYFGPKSAVNSCGSGAMFAVSYTLVDQR